MLAGYSFTFTEARLLTPSSPVAAEHLSHPLFDSTSSDSSMHLDPKVAVMESPSHDPDLPRTSTGSSTIIRASEGESNYDFLDGIHNVHGTNNYEAYDFDPALMNDFGHDMFKYKAPLPSVAPTATTGTTDKQKYRVLGTLSLTSILFFASCGGPGGSEPIISSGGPLVGLLGLGIYVLFVLTPLSLVVTELSCAFPENSGYSVWAMTAFGPFWGFQAGYWSWVASVTNNAIYPGLIYNTIANGYGVEASSTVVAFFAKVVIAIILAVPSYLGVRFVGVSAVVLLVFVCTTTLMFSVWGFADSGGGWFRLADIRGPDDVTEDSPDGGIDWSLLVHALFWSFDGLYDVSVIGGEVINPARTYPRVIFTAVVLAVITYSLPFISAISADRMSWLEFSEDSYPDIADAIGGSVLNEIIIISSVCSSIGLFTCTLFFQSFLVQGMAQSRLLPSLLRKRSARFKTPQYAILLSLVVTLTLVGFEFESILDMTNAFSGAVQIIIVLSMLKLRVSFPYLPRPVKVPGNVKTLAVVVAPAMSVFGYLIVSTLMEWQLACVVVGFTIVGVLFPFVRGRIAGHSGCC